MPKQRFGLGRGLDALIPGAPGSGTLTQVDDDVTLDTSLENSAIFELALDAISPNPHQPRAAIEDDEQMLELARSIEEYGLLQPLLVTLSGAQDGNEPTYTLIAGERRWRAARLAGLERVPVVIREATPQLMLEMALVENLQRTDLNPLEEAHGYMTLVEEYRLTQEQVAERIGRKRTSVANTIRLLQLPAEVRELLVTMPKAFTEGHARAVLQIVGDAERINAAKQIIAQQMSVRQAEELARRYNEAALRHTPDRRGGAGREQSFETKALEQEFIRAMEMKVRLHRNTKGKGSLTLFFGSDQQLETLYERLVRAAGVEGNGHSRFGLDESATLASVLDNSFDLPFDDGNGSAEQ